MALENTVSPQRRTPLYSYLRIHLNTLKYVDNVFMWKYAHIWSLVLKFLMYWAEQY